jgi:hypothetical protein
MGQSISNWKKTKINITNNNTINEIFIKRVSFSPRICDDLCEVLLSYLSFEDKIKFECVSHQFQRCIFNKENTLTTNRLDDKQNRLNQLLVYDRKKFADFRSHLQYVREFGNRSMEVIFNKNAFESVLKKCKFITQIIIKIDYIDNEVLQIIA